MQVRFQGVSVIQFVGPRGGRLRLTQEQRDTLNLTNLCASLPPGLQVVSFKDNYIGLNDQGKPHKRQYRQLEDEHIHAIISSPAIPAVETAFEAAEYRSQENRAENEQNPFRSRSGHVPRGIGVLMSLLHDPRANNVEAGIQALLSQAVDEYNAKPPEKRKSFTVMVKNPSDPPEAWRFQRYRE